MECVYWVVEMECEYLVLILAVFWGFWWNEMVQKDPVTFWDWKILRGTEAICEGIPLAKFSAILSFSGKLCEGKTVFAREFPSQSLVNVDLDWPLARDFVRDLARELFPRNIFCEGNCLAKSKFARKNCEAGLRGNFPRKSWFAREIGRFARDLSLANRPVFL